MVNYCTIVQESHAIKAVHELSRGSTQTRMSWLGLLWITRAGWPGLCGLLVAHDSWFYGWSTIPYLRTFQAQLITFCEHYFFPFSCVYMRINICIWDKTYNTKKKANTTRAWCWPLEKIMLGTKMRLVLFFKHHMQSACVVVVLPGLYSHGSWHGL